MCTYVPTQVDESCQYVPIIDVLKLVLSSKDIRKVITEEKDSSDNMLGSFRDGQHFKNHSFFQKHKDAIRLRLYYDELEIVNPLGSKTGVHKIGSFYYQIANLPAHVNSELSSIHVLLLFCYTDIQKYGFSKVLSPFLHDLSKLESDEGISLTFENGDSFILRASLESFCVDGLAIHDVFGLLSPKANKFCRLCLYSRHDLSSKSLNLGQERTEQLFNEHLDLLKRTNFADATKTRNGIKGPCCLNESKYFHISYNKVFDIMHDFLCGLYPMIVKLVLYEYVVIQKIFDTAYLNGKISLFNYGYLENKNKPSANFTDAILSRKEHNLSQKAMQIWCLTRSFPFLLAEKVNSEDNHMKLILYLLKMS
ncbi:uncharacterized protein [Prorops nasuta]|uniref:uncharacterized protein n=1 Tax=Prorops nasuta TaxID=863751 RepID=UPI0034CE49DC